MKTITWKTEIPKQSEHGTSFRTKAVFELATRFAPETYEAGRKGTVTLTVVPPLVRHRTRTSLFSFTGQTGDRGSTVRPEAMTPSNVGFPFRAGLHK
jgi:hypothetical protein